MKLTIVFQAAILLFFTTPLTAQKIKKYISKAKEVEYLETKEKQDSVLIKYLGCGGFYVQKGKNSLLIDPFFSNVGGMLSLPFSTIQSDSIAIDEFFQTHFGDGKDTKGEVKGVLVSHPHYDHLFDVPHIYKNHLNQDSTQIFCGLVTQEYLRLDGIQNVQNTKKIVPLNANAWRPFYRGQWVFSNNRRIKILPILSEHAPHFMGMKMIKTGCRIKTKTKGYPSKPLEMIEGSTFSFLIDFLDETGNVELRIMAHAGAGSTAPKGFPPPQELNKRAVDILLVCVANENQVKNYPDGLMKYCAAKKVILAHWENFFINRNQLKINPKTVPNTNVMKLIKKNKTKFFEKEYLLPAIDAEMLFYF